MKLTAFMYDIHDPLLHEVVAIIRRSQDLIKTYQVDAENEYLDEEFVRPRLHGVVEPPSGLRQGALRLYRSANSESITFMHINPYLPYE